jgi:hypothetical protein
VHNSIDLLEDGSHMLIKLDGNIHTTDKMTIKAIITQLMIDVEGAIF